MIPSKKLTYSVLDLVPITEGTRAREAYENSIKLAQLTEKLGFHRYWIAEHHNMPGIASAATSLVMSYIASATKTIRIGAGGIMLPNHAPLIVAEQFGTLEAMHPGRIDLGLGRAPGTDPLTAKALRRVQGSNGDDFPERLAELIEYLNNDGEKAVRAIPEEGKNIPIWLLGSSDFSARLAGMLGLPFSFASHFAPANTLPALKIYRDFFKKSNILQEPHCMAAINVFASNTHEQAEKMATSSKLQFLSLIRGKPGKMKPPVDNIEDHWNEREKLAVLNQLSNTLIGTKEDIKAGLEHFANITKANEIIVVCNAFHFEDRAKSYEILAEAMEI